MRLSISTVYIGLTLFCFDFSTTSPIEDHAVQTLDEVLDVNDVLQALKNDSSFDSLVCAVESVILTEGLVLVVSASPDPSLIIPNISFSHLTHPMSLKASIFQLVASLTNALRDSDNNMYKIGLLLKILDFELAFDCLNEIADPDAQEILTEFADDLKKNAKECLKIANSTEYDFVKVLDITQELNLAAIAKKAHDERNQFDLNAAKKEIELLKISKEEKRHRDEEDLKQIKQDVEQMYLDLKKEENKGGSIGLIVKDWFSDGKATNKWEDNVKNKKDRLQEEKKRFEERRKEFEANEEKIANFTALIQNVELKTMDLEKVITFIAEALQYLTVLHEKWSHLTNFFKKLTTAIEKNIVVNADNIKDITTDKVFRQRKNRGLLVQIASQAQEIVDIANKYNRLCHNHVNPLLEELSKSYVLDPQAVNLRKSTIGDRLSKVRSEVQRSFYQPTGDKAAIYIEEKMKNEEKAMKLLYNDEL